jgi:hypothetical protein
MEFQKKTSIGKSSWIVKILVKITIVVILFFIIVLLVDKIQFPFPNQKIEKIIKNENLKIIK